MGVHELWWLSLAIAAAVVVVVAALLGLVVAAARSIDRHASEIWTTGKDIAHNTVAIWLLEKTSESLERTRSSARALEHHSASIADRLRALDGGG